MSYVKLNNGKCVDAHLDGDCATAGTCVCGFHKGAGQCQFGDCRNALPVTGIVGTLCLECSAYEWRVALPGHRASVDATPDQIEAARDWATDCLAEDHPLMDHTERVSADRAVRYVQRNYQGGWVAFATEGFTVVTVTVG
ncbi:hypothetical protein ACK1X7_07375 [Streptomyces sp. CY1]|uniref:hypothetical protein n=1 Tax=Streptomyces sp. CY1 TaxID=3388313 RepID=UPI0039A23076